MVLKSTFGSKKSKKRGRGFSDTSNILRQGTTAIIGVGLLGVTADAVGRI